MSANLKNEYEVRKFILWLNHKIKNKTFISWVRFNEILTTELNDLVVKIKGQQVPIQNAYKEVSGKNYWNDYADLILRFESQLANS